MSKLAACTLAIAVSVGTTAMLEDSRRTIHPSPSAEARLAADGAFRDGLYLGKLAAESGQVQRPAVGRWSTEQDRVTFILGYQQGYTESLARLEP
jgi:hypothetical protein